MPCTGGRGPWPSPPCSSEKHPRSDRVGVGLPDARPHPGLFQKREQRAQAFACMCQFFLPSGEPAVEVGFLGPRAQTSICPGQCPDTALLNQLSLNSAHVWGQPLDPPHSSRDPMRPEQTGLSGRTPAGGMNYYQELSAMHRVAFHVPKVGWPWRLGSRALIPTVQGQKLYSIPQQQASAPHHLCSTPQRTPHPHPRARASLLHGLAQSRLDKGDSKVKFPRSL